MITVAILFIAIGVMLAICSFVTSEGDTPSPHLGICSGVVLTLGFIFLLSSDEERQPTAIDVYRGKTTLRISYEDSVAVDSIVVFK